MNWETEVRWNLHQVRTQGLTPYAEVKMWRRRFWYAFSVAVMAVVVAILKT